MNTSTTDLSVDEIARVAYEAVRAYQAVLGDPVNPPWADAPEWQRDSVIRGVRVAVGASSPAEQHEDWIRTRTEQGWTYGPVKDEGAKTHPCLVPYADLPLAQRRKDALFGAVARALSA